MLIYEVDYIGVYAAETAVLVLLMAFCAYGIRRDQPVLALGALLLIVITWLVCGFLAYAPAF